MKMDTLRLTAVNPDGYGYASVSLPNSGASASGPFVLKGADGLGPPEVNVRMARTALEGGVYQGKSPALRQIIAVIGLQPNWDEGETPEELRTQLYSMLTPKFGGSVRAEIVENNIVKAYAQGQIAKFEIALFSKDPAVQITLECDHPYLLAPTQTMQTPAQRNIMGQRGFDVVNEGTAPSGFFMQGILRANVGTSLILSDDYTFGQKLRIDGIQWNSGDIFQINTMPGSRGVWRGAAGGTPVSVLNNVNAAISEWLQLGPGNNTLRLNTTAFDWSGVNFIHRAAYWGV